MFGKTIIQKCSQCNKENKVELGIVRIYKDEQGEFYCTGQICECGHILNSERLSNAKVVGSACY